MTWKYSTYFILYSEKFKQLNSHDRFVCLGFFKGLKAAFIDTVVSPLKFPYFHCCGFGYVLEVHDLPSQQRDGYTPSVGLCV